MKREGTHMSIWQSDVIKNSAPIEAATAFDFKIEGQGLIALTIALLLQQRGKKCLLVQHTTDNIDFPLTYLSTMQEKGYSGFLMSAGTEKTTALANSAREAIDLAERWITEHNIDCDFVYEPGFLYTGSKENVAALSEEQIAAEKAGLVVTPVHSIPVSVPFEAACRFEFQARLHPVHFYNGLLAAFQKTGGFITNNADNIHTAATISITESDLGTVQKNSCHLAFPLTAGTYPYGIAESNDGAFSFQPAKIGEKEYVIATLCNADTPTEGLEKLEAFVQAHFQYEAINHKWSVPYAVSQKHHFSIENKGGNTFSVSGLGKNGFTNSIIAGLLIADIVTGVENPGAGLFLS